MLRRTFVSCMALLPFGKCFGMQERTGYVATNPIKTEEEAVQELYRQFKKKDDFGCKYLNVRFDNSFSYKDSKKECVCGIIIHWMSHTAKIRKNKETVNFHWDSDSVSVSTDYLDEAKLTKLINKRFSDYNICGPMNVNFRIYNDDGTAWMRKKLKQSSDNPNIFYAVNEVRCH